MTSLKMASPLKEEPSEERIYMEEDPPSYTPALGHPGYGQTLSDLGTPSNSGSQGNEFRRDSFGILSEGRPVRLVLYDRHRVDNTRTIWIDFESTYSDVANELTEIVANRTFVMLQPIWGPLPCWIEANPDSLIGTTCHTLYVILESVGYILGVVRTSLSDYPIAIFEGPLDPSATVSEAVVASHPKLSGQIKSITSFTDQIIKDTQGGYDSLRQYSSSRAPVVIMTVDESPTQFMSDLPDESIPPLLQVSFAYCKCLLQRGHDQDFFALQIIHLLRAILHTIISLALKMEKFFEDDAPDIETALNAEDDMADLLRVAPLLSHELQTLLYKLNGMMDALEAGDFEGDAIHLTLSSVFVAICAEYPGAVTTRRSYRRFKRLGDMDRDEMYVIFPRTVPNKQGPIRQTNSRSGQVDPPGEPSPISPSTNSQSRIPDWPDHSESPATPTSTEEFNDPEQDEGEPTASASTFTVTASPTTVHWAGFNVPDNVLHNPAYPVQPSNEDLLVSSNVGFSDDWNSVLRRHFELGGILDVGTRSYSRMNPLWDMGEESIGASGDGIPPRPLATGSSTQTPPNGGIRSSLTLLHTHRDAIFQSTWFRNNEVEPPMQPDDPLVRHGLLTLDGSRFDLFIHSTSDRHNCLYVHPGSTETCSYSNLRRQRVKVHVLSHFSYKPFVCDGSCGKADCNLGFADNALLGEHVRRVGRPRAQCEICGAITAPQNYRRHMNLKHGGN